MIATNKNHKVPDLRLVHDKCAFADKIRELMPGYLDGSLPDEACDEIDQHVKSGCKDCRRTFRSAGQQMLGLAAPKEEHSEPRLEGAKEDDDRPSFPTKPSEPVVCLVGIRRLNSGIRQRRTLSRHKCCACARKK